MTEIFTTYWQACVIGTFLLLFTLDFLTRFLLRGIILRRRLTRSIREMEEIRNITRGAAIDLDSIAGNAMTTNTLGDLWHEYAKTLHPQREPDGMGRNWVVCWRATALAEAFFTNQAVVDSPLRTDYYKHLPGILTGIGIIGTFTGLIQGLLNFNVSPDSGAMEAALRSLMVSVGRAFVISGSAIFLAMAFTFIEKLLISSLYRKVEKLQQKINALFTGGAEDEYLERIVKASETSATQAVQIKDSLVADLKQILSDMTAQQVAASSRQSDRISSDLGKTIAGSLEPISQAVASVAANQGEAVSKLLVDVLASFSSQIRDMFGGQMAATHQLLQTMNTAIQATAGKFEQLAANMDNRGKNTTDAMAERLTQAVGALESRQQMFNQQMAELTTQLRATASETQAEAAQKLQESLSAVVGQLHRQAEAFAGRQEEQISRISRESGSAIGSISSQVEQLIAQSMQTTQGLQASISALTASTGDSIAKMNSSAEILSVAANDLARTGTRVAESLRLASGTVEGMREAAESLTRASTTTQEVSAEYARSRDVFARMVTDLKETVENARREASMTGEVLVNLKRGADQLNQAEKRAADYLAEINDVLGKAHEAFATNIEKTLRSANGDFHKHLAEAVGHLSGGIQDLGELLEQIPAQR
jgi:ABC-type transporter Mla subunit MlaD